MNKEINTELGIKVAPIIDRMSMLSTIWSIVGILVGFFGSLITMFVLTLTVKSESFLGILFFTPTIFATICCFLLSSQYFKLEKQTRFFQKMTGKNIELKKFDFLIGKNFYKLEKKILDFTKSIPINTLKVSNDRFLTHEFNKLNKLFYFDKSNYSIYIPLIIFLTSLFMMIITIIVSSNI